MTAQPTAIFLSTGELYELTGYRLAAYQVRWLQRQGITHWVRADGKPVVPRSALEGRPAAAPVPEPDWSAIVQRG